MYLGLFGDFDPDDLTARIGIVPTKSARAGEHVPGKVPKTSIWRFSSPHVEGEVVDVGELSRGVVRALAPHADAIAKAREELGLAAWFEVVLHISTDDSISTPIITFDQEVIAFVHRVGAGIDVDTYRNTPEDSEQTPPAYPGGRVATPSGSAEA